jgi:hypothetical protein
MIRLPQLAVKPEPLSPANVGTDVQFSQSQTGLKPNHKDFPSKIAVNPVTS